MDSLENLAGEFTLNLGCRPHIKVLQIPTQTIDELLNRHPEIRLPFPAFSVGATLLNNAFGLIVLEENFLSNFDVEETKFILAHETAHINKNHSVISLILSVLGDEIKNIVKKRYAEKYRYIEGLWNLGWILFTRTTFDGFIVNRQEKEADLLAVQLINNKSKAISALEKLAKKYANGDFNAPSHTTYVKDIAIPAITYKERIQAIQNMPLRAF